MAKKELPTRGVPLAACNDPGADHVYMGVPSLFTFGGQLLLEAQDVFTAPPAAEKLARAWLVEALKNWLCCAGRH